MNNIIPNGTRVKIIEAGIVATVHSCAVAGIDNPIIEYNLIYWIGGERKQTWVYNFEVEEYIETKKKAGMVNYETGVVKA